MHPLDNSKVASYTVTFTNGIISSVPISEANRHYQEVLKWEEEEGNTIEEAD